MNQENTNELPQNRRRHCLVAEDNAFAADVLALFLDQQHFDVDLAENGQVALDLYLAHPERYDIVIMDLQMPVLSGYDATERIRGSGCAGAESIPILAVSGYPLSDLSGYRFTDSLRKPFEMRTLLAVINRLLA